MATATAPKRGRTKSSNGAAPAKKTISIPAKCKPSRAASTDKTRPVITHGFLIRHDKELWLCTTDSYVAVAIQVRGDADEGFIPIDALRLMEKGREAEQIDRTTWKVLTPDGTATFDCGIQVGTGRPPDLAKLGLFDAPEKTKEAVFPVGANPTLIKKVSDALGASDSCRFDFVGPLRPIHVSPPGLGSERRALLMPIRLNV